MKKFLLAFVVLSAVVGMCLVLWIQGITTKIFLPQPKLASATKNTVSQHFTDNTPIDMVLLGYGGGNHDGAYLTDSILDIHIDQQTHKVFLIAIPRDIWIKIPTDGIEGNYWKINAAYELGLDDTNYPNKQPQFTGPSGGGKMAEYIVSKVTGLPVDHFLGMDFAGFTKTIDTLGGVTVPVEKTFDDYEYPLTGKEADLCGHQATESALLDQEATQSAVESIFPCRYEHLHFDKGLTHMDGTTALKYVRSRHSSQDGSDFGRAKRQQNLLVAVKEKIFSVSFIPQIIPFMSTLGDDLRTDMSFSDVQAYLSHIHELSSYHITTIALTDQNYLTDSNSSDGQAILLPKAGMDNWTSIHNYITDTFAGKQQMTSALVQVQNGTHHVGLAQLGTNRLQSLHIQTINPTSAISLQAHTSILISDKNIDPTDVASLKKEFGVAVTTDQQSISSGNNVTVIVGEDYYQTQGKQLIQSP